MILFIIGIIIGISGTLYIVPIDRMYRRRIRNLEELHAKETAQLRMKLTTLEQIRRGI